MREAIEPARQWNGKRGAGIAWTVDEMWHERAIIAFAVKLMWQVMLLLLLSLLLLLAFTITTITMIITIIAIIAIITITMIMYPSLLSRFLFHLRREITITTIVTIATISAICFAVYCNDCDSYTYWN